MTATLNCSRLTTIIRQLLAIVLSRNLACTLQGHDFGNQTSNIVIQRNLGQSHTTYLMSLPAFHHCWPLRPAAMPGSSSHPSHNDAELCLNGVNKPECCLSPPASMTINPALTPLLFLFRSIGRTRRNRRTKSFRSHYETGMQVVCEAVRMHGHFSRIDKCWPPSEGDCSYTNAEYPSAPTHIYFPPPFCHPRRPVTTTSTCTGYSYRNHHVMSASDHQ